MALSIKTRIAGGIGVLFGLLLLTTIVALVAINLLSNRTESLLTANYKSIQYCNDMMHALDAFPRDCAGLARFDTALSAQERNITEQGETAATKQVRLYFTQLQAEGYRSEIIDSINAAIYRISATNQRALEQKNRRALATASDAKLWLSFLATLVILVGFSLTLNLPSTIAGPVKEITAGIREIAAKNYGKRIVINNRDEFGEMAAAFNSMAERLYEWENSSYAQLMFEKTRVDSIISQMDDAVLGLDADGRVLFLNDAAARLFHLNVQEISGKPATEVAARNDLFRAVIQGEHKGPLKIVLDGKEQFFTRAHKAVAREGKALGDVYTLKNITQFKELDLSKTNLLATISHELKTPISSIKMSATLLEDERIGGMNEEQRDMVHSITEDAERLLRLTAELLNLTQIETGNIQLRFLHISPKTIVDEAVAAVAMQAQSKRITIHQSVPDDLPLIQADADKTALVLVNLLSNAIKYSQEGRSVALIVERVKSCVSFRVKDEGEGIDPLFQDRIFDRYFKVPGSINKTGTGLGLAISKEFIEAQGGEISVKSEVGGGSEFRFELPMA